MTRPIMPNIERPVAIIGADRDQLRRGLLSTGGWSESVATDHVTGLPDTDGALQMLARHRIASALTADSTQAGNAVLAEALDSVAANLDSVPFNDIVQARAVVERAANVLRMVCAALSAGGAA